MSGWRKVRVGPLAMAASTADLSATRTALFITASNVVLDVAGRTIIGTKSDAAFCSGVVVSTGRSGAQMAAGRPAGSTALSRSTQRRQCVRPQHGPRRNDLRIGPFEFVDRSSAPHDGRFIGNTNTDNND